MLQITTLFETVTEVMNIEQQPECFCIVQAEIERHVNNQEHEFWVLNHLKNELKSSRSTLNVSESMMD